MWTGKKKNNFNENLTQDLFLFFFKAREQLVKEVRRRESEEEAREEETQT